MRVPERSAAPAAELRVAVDALSLWRPLTGIGQYTWNIARSWAAQGGPPASYFYGNDWSDHAAPRTAAGLGALRRLARGALPRSYELSRAMLQRRFDRRPQPCAVYFEPSFLPFRFDGPMVLTVHDLSHVRHPQTHPAQRVRILDRLLPPALERAAHVLTVSEFQRREILAVYGLPAARVSACHEGVGTQFRPRPAADCAALLARLGLRWQGYFLAVGTLEPRKNLATALQAHARLPAALRQACPLVLAGSPGWHGGHIADALQAGVRAGEVRALGHVDDDDLPLLYSAARLFLYPSLYEGFGLPVLEAMASGVPVIASNRSSLPEVVGDAGVLLEPLDVVALSQAIERLCADADEWQRLSQAGREQARRFSWSACAAQTAAVLQSAARGGV